MLLIPKHIQNFMAELETELHRKDSPSTRFFLQDLADLKRSIYSLSHMEYTEEHLRIMLFYIQKVLKLEHDAHVHTGIPRLGKFSKEVIVDERLIHLLNKMNMEVNDLTLAARSLSSFIDLIPNGLEPEEANCDFKEFRLITQKATWEKLMSIPGIDVKYTNNAGKPNRLKLYFVRREGYHSVYPKDSFDEIKDFYKKNANLYTQDGFEAIKEAFDIWFHVGSKGTYYVYIED